MLYRLVPSGASDDVAAGSSLITLMLANQDLNVAKRAMEGGGRL